MGAVHYTTCHLCEASCGVVVEHEDGRVLRVRGDRDDPLSRGHVCPKVVGLADIHHDPRRLRRPMERVGSSWRELDWDQALDKVAERLTAIQAAHGPDAVALYLGNPTVHSVGAMIYSVLFRALLATRNAYTSNSVDALPRLYASSLLYGSQLALPVPDVDRTDFWLVLGANPAVSNGSVMTAPGLNRRIKAIRDRGGQVVVIDPRRTETADLASRHHFVRPGTDAYLLAAMLHTLFRDGVVAPGPLAARVTRLDALHALVAELSPERVADTVGMDARDIESLARDFARAPSAVAYGRFGTCTQRFGALTAWLIDCLNIVTGNLDRPGGAMFAAPPVDLLGLASLIGAADHQGRWTSRMSGLPEFNGELPAVAMAEEMETPGERQVRALVVHAGNPVLSVPNGARLERALPGLDFVVAIDIYRNETTRHADIILPPTFGLERDHYPLIMDTVAVRNTAKYSRAAFARSADARHDWEIFAGLIQRMLAMSGGRMPRRTGWRGRLAGLVLGRVARARPETFVRLGLRLGPYRLSLAEVLRHPHGLDLGPLQPRLARVLRSRSIELVPAPMAADMARLHGELQRADNDDDELWLISRRQLRSNNSWMHHVARLAKGKPRCVLLMHPDDASARSIAPGDRVRVVSRQGALEVPVEVSREMMPGVVSLPHGWGHDRSVDTAVAGQDAGASINDLTDDHSVDPLSGCASLAIKVCVSKIAHSARVTELAEAAAGKG